MMQVRDACYTEANGPRDAEADPSDLKDSATAHTLCHRSYSLYDFRTEDE
jgi:hypothetical protein